LVDDSEEIRSALNEALQSCVFDVVTAANVNEALRLIAGETFDVPLIDLHTLRPGDGLKVVSAIRHSNSKAVALRRLY
jgi:DNA-binding response OmpR family regulator